MNKYINVGIISAEEIHFFLNNDYTQQGNTAKGQQMAKIVNGKISWQDKEYDGLTFQPVTDGGSFTIEDVVIGVNFHWQRKQRQTFLGELHLIVNDGKIVVINRLLIESYLESVISSEMSATSSLELLKAHAVISRSWVINQLENNQSPKRLNDESPKRLNDEFPKRLNDESPKRLIKWYDHQDHTLFDVCADDHCQRYQGITNTANPHVVQAVRETAGEVLMYDGEVCDTRFSKCCGGITEEYQYCWDNISKPYLKSVHDPYCNTQDWQILSEVLNDYDQETVDFYDWYVSYTQEELSTLVARKLSIDLGRIKALEPLERGKSGRISLLRIVGEKDVIEIGKELEIRKTLSPTHLYSSAFNVHLRDVDADGYPKQIILNGKGWGHGVGLCQIGAAVMGAKGFTYTDILSHYYPGANVCLQ